MFLHLMALAAATLSGFTFPTVHIGHTAIETESHLVPTMRISRTSFETVSTVVPTTHRTIHVTKTVVVSVSTVAPVNPTTVEMSHSTQRTRDAKTSDTIQPSVAKESRNISQSHTAKTSATTSSSSVASRSSNVYSASSFITETSSWSTEPTPSETTAPTVSGPSIDEISSRIGIALAVVVVLIAVVLYLCLAIWPKQRLRRAQKAQAQLQKRNWWVWRKRNRDQPGVATRAIEVDQVQHMTPSSPAAFGEYNGFTVTRPLNSRTATTASLWPVRNDHVWSIPEPIRFPFQGISREVPINSGSSTFSFDTLDGELEAAYVRQDQTHPYQPYVEDEFVEEPSQAELRRPPTCLAAVVENRGRPVSEVASLGTNLYGEFEDVPLH